MSHKIEIEINFRRGTRLSQERMTVPEGKPADSQSIKQNFDF